jgi:hypothetical protein
MRWSYLQPPVTSKLDMVTELALFEVIMGVRVKGVAGSSAQLQSTAIPPDTTLLGVRAHQRVTIRTQGLTSPLCSTSTA